MAALWRRRVASMVDEASSSKNPTVGLYLGPYGGPRVGEVSYEQGTPVPRFLMSEVPLYHDGGIVAAARGFNGRRGQLREPLV